VTTDDRLDPGHAAALTAMRGVAHGFFTRAGGVSQGVYRGLNCGLGSRDDRARVLENRARVARSLGTTGDKLLTAYQIHSATAIVARAPWTFETMPRADAIVTDVPGLAVGALAADCTPVLFADPQARVVAAAHAGWKGALGDVLAATVATMESLGAERSRIVAAVGPTIGQANYEVGPEFLAAFLAEDQANKHFFSEPGSADNPGGRPHFDLPGFVRARLDRLELGGVEIAAHCTYADESKFFSFRRTTHRKEADYGRQISAVMLT
jgi:polyphenol oxidase